MKGKALCFQEHNIFLERLGDIIMNVVLYEPEIPQNTGNIARTCAATGVKLHLIKPLGFSVDEKSVKRAGLDYWHLLDITYYEDIDDFFAKNPGREFYFCTTKAPKVYSDVKYTENSYLIFGKESAGIPDELLRRFHDQCVRIPMVSDARSLNLSNAVAVILYEALRQNQFVGLKGGSDYL